MKSNYFYVGGYLNGKGKVSLQNVDCTLEGNFVNGKLHGPVRGLTSKGKSVVACPCGPTIQIVSVKKPNPLNYPILFGYLTGLGQIFSDTS